jgi:hypothetical protein
MKTIFIAVIIFLLPDICQAQIYNKDKVCGTDTIHINHRDLKYGTLERYDAFACTQVSKPGIRVNIAFSSFCYNGSTDKLMDHHNAAVLGFALAYGKFNLGVDFDVATVFPKSDLPAGNDTLTKDAKLNPIKSDFYAAYSIDLKNNFSFEPHVGVTKNQFHVINEKELNKTFDIPVVYGLNCGLTLNKYFMLKEFQFICVFLSYSYGFTDYKKINPDLGKGYSEWSVGISYKVFAKRQFYERLN